MGKSPSAPSQLGTGSLIMAENQLTFTGTVTLKQKGICAINGILGSGQFIHCKPNNPKPDNYLYTILQADFDFGQIVPTEKSISRAFINSGEVALCPTQVIVSD